MIAFTMGLLQANGPASPASSPSSNPSPIRQEKNATVELAFTPEPVEQLKQVVPQKRWKLQKSIELQEVAGKKKVHLLLYAGTHPDSPADNEITGIVEDSGTFYSLGTVSSYGMDVEVKTSDRNHDGINEIEIAGQLGAAYKEMKVIGYDPKQHSWVRFLATGTPEEVDLDGDGQDELVAVSAGTIPSYVWIYRWNQDHFEKADVAASTGKTSARLTEQKTFEVANMAEGTDAQPESYKYRNGKLIKMAVLQ